MTGDEVCKMFMSTGVKQAIKESLTLICSHTVCGESAAQLISASSTSMTNRTCTHRNCCRAKGTRTLQHCSVTPLPTTTIQNGRGHVGRAGRSPVTRSRDRASAESPPRAAKSSPEAPASVSCPSRRRIGTSLSSSLWHTAHRLAWHHRTSTKRVGVSMPPRRCGSRPTAHHFPLPVLHRF